MSLLDDPDVFFCAFCGRPTLWRFLGGWSRRLRFCETCIDLMRVLFP